MECSFISRLREVPGNYSRQAREKSLYGDVKKPRFDDGSYLLVFALFSLYIYIYIICDSIPLFFCWHSLAYIVCFLLFFRVVYFFSRVRAAPFLIALTSGGLGRNNDLSFETFSQPYFDKHADIRHEQQQQQQQINHKDTKLNAGSLFFRCPSSRTGGLRAGRVDAIRR